MKSCLADVKSGHGLNFGGDENYLVMPVEVHPGFVRAYHDRDGDSRYADKRLHEAVPSLSGFEFLWYGIGRNGAPAFKAGGDGIRRLGRRMAASELLLRMMRAMIADSGHSDVSHPVGREVG